MLKIIYLIPTITLFLATLGLGIVEIVEGVGFLLPSKSKKCQSRAGEVLGNELREKKEYSVADYLARMEQGSIKIMRGIEEIGRYKITLWAGLEGLQLNEDGSTEWVKRGINGKVPNVEELETNEVGEDNQLNTSEANTNEIQRLNSMQQRMNTINAIDTMNTINAINTIRTYYPSYHLTYYPSCYPGYFGSVYKPCYSPCFNSYYNPFYPQIRY